MGSTLTVSSATGRGIPSEHGIAEQGISTRHTEHWNLSPAELVEHAVRNSDGKLVDQGPFNAITAPHTGRSPNDRYVVREKSSEEHIWWGGTLRPTSRGHPRSSG